MKPPALAAVCSLLPLAIGCGRAPATPRMAASAASQPMEVARRPTLVEGGSMSRDGAAFRDYLRTSDVVATGKLTSWGGREAPSALKRSSVAGPTRNSH